MSPQEEYLVLDRRKYGRSCRRFVRVDAATWTCTTKCEMKAPSVSSPSGKKLFGYRRIKQTTSSSNKSYTPTPTKSPIEESRHEHKVANKSPLVLPNVSASEVKRRTGFPSLSHMLGYIIIIVNGNIDAISEKVTSLTWFEE